MVSHDLVKPKKLNIISRKYRMPTRLKDINDPKKQTNKLKEKQIFQAWGTLLLGSATDDPII